MLRRSITSLALLAAVAAPLAARADDGWNDERTDEWTDEGPAPDGYDVSVDLNVQGSANLDTFDGALSPYGEWVVVGGHGRVWRPHVAAGWRPYYYGRWEWTNEGWLWVSDEPFGWAAYHYGRWTYDSFYGWVWVPGYQWAPAWVAWRYSGDVVGWAPLGPGISVYVSNYPFVDYWWTFVPCTRFVGYPAYTVAYAPHYTRRYFYDTAPAPPRPVARPVPGGRPVPAPAWGGPAPRAIEQRTGRPITPVRVVAAPTPGAARARPGVVEMYRPGGARPARPAPVRDGFAPGRGGAPVPVGRGRDERFSGPDPGRGSGAYPAPGRVDRGDVRRGFAPPGPQLGDERRGGGWVPPGRQAPPPRSEGRGNAPPPRSEGGGRSAPAVAPAPRSSGGGGGGEARAHPAPPRERDHR
jgi:hypothetical protein